MPSQGAYIAVAPPAQPSVRNTCAARSPLGLRAGSTEQSPSVSQRLPTTVAVGICAIVRCDYDERAADHRRRRCARGRRSVRDLEDQGQEGCALMSDATKHIAFRPDYAIAPGETLRDLLAEERLSQADLAARAGLSAKHVNQILQGR